MTHKVIETLVVVWENSNNVEKLALSHVISRHYAMFVVIRLFKKKLKFLITANL